jgi:hypothetical protein
MRGLLRGWAQAHGGRREEHAPAVAFSHLHT